MDINSSSPLPSDFKAVFQPTQETELVNIIDSEVLIRNYLVNNHEKGYELLFKRYYQPLCSHAVRFVYSKEVAEDLVMDVFSQFWHKKLHLAVNTSYRAYLFTTVRHAAYSFLRKELGRESQLDIVSSSEESTNPQQLLQFDELSHKIEEIIGTISPQSQRVFILSRFEGKKNAEIAEELNLSIKTIEGHITKVLSVLRKSLKHHGMISLFMLNTFSVLEPRMAGYFPHIIKMFDY